MAYDEEVLTAFVLAEETLEVGYGGFRGEGGGLEDPGLVAGLGGDELGGLEGSA